MRVGPWPEPDADGACPTTSAPGRRCGCSAVADDRQAIELDGRPPASRSGSTVHRGGERADAERRRAPWRGSCRRGSSTTTPTPSGGGPVCPLPGTVIAVHVSAGDAVADGQLLMVVEAMKMEHKITAPWRSRVAEVRFAVGDRVDAGDLLVVLEAAEPMTEPIRIANCSGFFGDRLSGARRDGRGRPDRRADRRLARRADDADPQPDPGQAARRGVRPHVRRRRWNR